MRRKDIPSPRIESQGAWPRGLKTRACSRVAACKKGDVVPHINQRLGKVRHHAFRAAIELGRNCFVQRRDLRNTHASPPFKRFAQIARVRGRQVPGLEGNEMAFVLVRSCRATHPMMSSRP